MKDLKRLSISGTLILVFTAATFAGSPCPSPDPGETHAPPCAATMTIGASLDAGGPTSPPASSVGDATLIGEIAADLLQSALSLL